MTILRATLVAAFLALSLLPAKAAEPESLEALGKAFCVAKDFAPEAAMKTLLTASLAAAVQRAVEVNARIAAAHPDDKPPLGDGVPFQRFPDRAPVCEVGRITGAGAGALIEIRHVFPGSADASWSDRLLVGPGQTGGLGIDDVLYDATGDDSLRKLLGEVVE